MSETEEQTIEYSENPVCYDISNDAERPTHNNWVIAAGTTVLVDFDCVVKARIQQHDQAIYDAVEQKTAKMFDEFEKNGVPFASNTAKVQYEGFRDYFTEQQRTALQELREGGV